MLPIRRLVQVSLKPYISKCLNEYKKINVRAICVRNLIYVWNSLPADVNFSSVNTFKRDISVLILLSFKVSLLTGGALM